MSIPNQIGSSQLPQTVQNVAQWLAAQTDANAVTTGADIIVAIGQSNMVGNGTAYDNTKLDPVDPRIKVYPCPGAPAGYTSGSATWGALAADLTNVVSGLGTPQVEILAAAEPSSSYHASGNAGIGTPGMGPAIPFAREYVKTIPPNRDVIIVTAAYDGTAFSLPDSNGHDLTWNSTVTGNLYSAAVAQAQAALALNPNNRIVAFVWLQGESDAINGAQASYQTNLEALITAIRAQFGTTIPFVLGQMTKDFIGTNSSSAASIINQIHINTPTRQQFTGFGYGPPAGNGDPLNGTIHHSAAAQRYNGKQMWKAYQRALLNVTGVAPVAPTVAPTLVQSGTSVAVAWTQPSCRYTAFPVRYSTDGGSTWTALAATGTVDVTATITGLTLGGTVQVQYAVTNEQGTSAWSPSATLTLATLPAKVSGVTLTPASTTVTVAWSAVSGATSYTIQRRSPSGSGSYTTVASGLTGTSAVIGGESPNTGYGFTVTAVNAAGSGTASDEATTTTNPPQPLFGTGGSVTDATPAYALSTRCLVASYGTGAAMDVRYTDNTTATINFLSTGLLDTATLLSGASAHGGSAYVTKWYDQSGNGHHFTQATAANQPTIVSSNTLVTAGGQPALQWGATINLSCADASLWSAGAATTAIVATTPSTYNGQGYGFNVGSGAGTGYFRYQPNLLGSTTPQYAIVQTPDSIIVDSSGPAWANSTTAQVTMTDTGSVWTQTLTTAATGTNSTTGSYSRPTATTTPTTTWLGSPAGGSSMAGMPGGSISEAVAFTSALSSADQTAAQSNQNSWYGT